jgi:sporulation protein YlmC with PRC-barrel domain
MIFKCLAIALLATASMTGAASAQTATNQVDSTTSATTHKEGEWRASKLAGVDVYNEANEKIGDINEVILDRSGKVANVILGVGGVLGLGEHYVAVAFDKLKWVDQPVTSTTASTTFAPANAPATSPPPDGTTRTTTTGAVTTTTTTTTTSASKHWYPDHAVYNATKDELKANRSKKPPSRGRLLFETGASYFDARQKRLKSFRIVRDATCRTQAEAESSDKVCIGM